MARIAVSQLPREASGINVDDRFLVDQPSVMNPVTETMGDTRKISPSVLAQSMIEQDELKDFIDEKVTAEQNRAEAAEQTNADAAEAAMEAAQTAQSGVNRIDQTMLGKADKVTVPLIKTLVQSAVGDVLGVVTFDTLQTPVAPAAAGNIILADGSRFDLAVSGNMTFTDAVGAVTQIISGGAWVIGSVNTGTAAITSKANANSGVWSFGNWVSGSTQLNLSDVKQLTEVAQNTANGALATATAALPRADVVNDLITGGANKALSAEQGKVEAAARAAADSALGVRIDGLETLGHYVGAYDNYETPAAAGNTIVPANKSDFPNGITVNDFVTVRADETHDNKVTRYVAETIDTDTGDITWVFDFAISIDVTGKADKVAAAIAGHIAVLTAGGNLGDSGISAVDILALLSDKSIPLLDASALTLTKLTDAFTAAGLTQQGKFAAVRSGQGIMLTYLYSMADGTPSVFIAFGVRMDMPGKIGLPVITSAVISDNSPVWTSERDFTVNQIQTGELADSAVTRAKLALRAVQNTNLDLGLRNAVFTKSASFETTAARPKVIIQCVDTGFAFTAGAVIEVFTPNKHSTLLLTLMPVTGAPPTPGQYTLMEGDALVMLRVTDSGQAIIFDTGDIGATTVKFTYALDQYNRFDIGNMNDSFAANMNMVDKRAIPSLKTLWGKSIVGSGDITNIISFSNNTAERLYTKLARAGLNHNEVQMFLMPDVTSFQSCTDKPSVTTTGHYLVRTTPSTQATTWLVEAFDITGNKLTNPVSGIMLNTATDTAWNIQQAVGKASKTITYGTGVSVDTATRCWVQNGFLVISLINVAHPAYTADTVFATIAGVQISDPVNGVMQTPDGKTAWVNARNNGENVEIQTGWTGNTNSAWRTAGTASGNFKGGTFVIPLAGSSAGASPLTVETLTLTMNTGWSAGSITVKRYGKVAVLNGTAQSHPAVNASTGGLIMTLPAGWRPTSTACGFATKAYNAPLGGLQITTAGQVNFWSGEAIAANSELNIGATWMCEQ